MRLSNAKLRSILGKLPVLPLLLLLLLFSIGHCDNIDEDDGRDFNASGQFSRTDQRERLNSTKLNQTNRPESPTKSLAWARV